MTLIDAAKLVAALGTLFAFGFGLTALLAREVPLDRFERFGIAYLLGVGAASMLWIVLAPFYAIVSPIVLISAIAWMVAGIARVRRKPDTSRYVPEPARGGWAVVLTLLLAVELIALTAASLGSGLGFDAVFNFEVKARVAFENQTPGQIPLAFFGDASRVWSHPRYPLLVPFAEYWIYGWLGRVDQFLVKIIFPMFFAALIAVTAGAMRRISSPLAALAAVTALGALPALTVIPGAISGYAEVPLAAAVAAAVCCAIVAVKTGRAEAFRLCGALSAIAAWTIVEGGILALCLAAAGLIVAGRKALPMLVMPVAVVAAWMMFQHFYGVPEKDFPSLSPQIALANLNRIPVIARVVARELITPGHWGLLWPAFVLTCALALAKRTWRDADLLIAAVVVIPLCVYPAIYLFSSWADVEGHVRTSFVRLLVPLAPAALMFTLAQLWLPHHAAAKA